MVIRKIVKLVLLSLELLGLSSCWQVMAVGHWIPLLNTAPGEIGVMLLLSDGTVMAQACTNANDCGTEWCRLTPTNGSYIYGNWSALAPMHYMRVNYSSVVLSDGRVFVDGGEGSDDIGSDHGEVYDPQTNKWTSVALIPSNLWNYNVVNGFADQEAMLLPGGTVLAAPTYPQSSGQNLLYNPITDSWSAAGPLLGSQSEACWVKLPDDSILSIDFMWDGLQATNSERYVPSLNKWLVDANVPVNIYSNQEMGAALLLPDRRAFFLGGSGHTALYTPSGTTNPGTWAIGPNIPDGRVAADAPAAMMINGKILCAVGPYAVNGGSPTPTWFYEYDYSSGATGSFAKTSSPGDSTVGSAYAGPSGNFHFLDLPDGTVLASDGADPSGQLYVYQPDSGPLPAGKPIIATINQNADRSYHLSGTGLNGISAGAAFGDDAQMDSNYPLVRLTDRDGKVYYGRTYNWSSTSVMTGTRSVSTEFALPPALSSVSQADGPLSLVVVANGIPSDPVTLYGPVWVDFNYTGSVQSGTYAAPFKTLAQGTNAVLSGGTIAIKTGLSHETMRISKPMTVIAVGGSAIVGQ